MTNFTQRMDLVDIDKGAGDSFAQHILSVWRQTEGNLVDDYIPAFPKLVMFDGNPVVDNTPDLLECGHEALPLKILGNTWAENANAANAFLPKQYRAMVGRSYFEAITQNQPVADIIRADMQNEFGHDISVIYQRLVLPVRTGGGSSFLLSYSYAHGKVPLAPGYSEDSQSRANHRQGMPDYANLFQSAARSSQTPVYHID